MELLSAFSVPVVYSRKRPALRTSATIMQGPPDIDTSASLLVLLQLTQQHLAVPVFLPRQLVVQQTNHPERVNQCKLKKASRQLLRVVSL